MWSEATLEQHLDGADDSFTTELMELFRADTLRLSSALRSAVHEADRAAIERLGHELQGAAAAVGAERVAACTRALRDAARADDARALSRTFAALERALDETHGAMALAGRRATGHPRVAAASQPGTGMRHPRPREQDPGHRDQENIYSVLMVSAGRNHRALNGPCDREPAQASFFQR